MLKVPTADESVGINHRQRLAALVRTFAAPTLLALLLLLNPLNGRRRLAGTSKKGEKKASKKDFKLDLPSGARKCPHCGRTITGTRCSNSACPGRRRKFD
jgi:hypothetical protein